MNTGMNDYNNLLRQSSTH